MLVNLKKILKERVRFLRDAVLYRPWGVSMGPRSLIRRPYQIYNRQLIKIGEDCRIGRSVVLSPHLRYGNQVFHPELILGNDVYIGSYCQIHAIQSVRIGNGCVLSDYIYISDNAHGLDPMGPPIMKQALESKGPVNIGNRVFIGLGSTVVSGVTLGDHCVGGSRSVVTKSFPAFSMIAAIAGALSGVSAIAACSSARACSPAIGVSGRRTRA